MQQDEALKIIKAVIDQSIAKGLIDNIDIAVKIAEAYNFIISELTINKD